MFYPGLRDLAIGRVEMLPTSSSSAGFNANYCTDNNLTTVCRPGGNTPNAIALELDGDFPISVKSVTIYTPQSEVEGYNPDRQEIQVDMKHHKIVNAIPFQDLSKLALGEDMESGLQPPPFWPFPLEARSNKNIEA